MGLALNSQTKNVIYNVYKYFRERKLDPRSSEHRDDINVYKTVAAAVGVSHRSVMRVAKEGNRLQAEHGRVVFEDPKNKKKDDVDLDTAIRAKFLEFVKRKEKPTINKIRIELLEDGVLLCSYDYMKVQLKRLGFKFRPARPRLRGKLKVKSEDDDDDGDGDGDAAGGISGGVGLEHVTVKLEPLEPGHRHQDAGAGAEGEPYTTTTTTTLPPHVTLTTDALQYDVVHIKVEQHEYYDDD